jgi:hypothetical protein
MRVSRIRKSFSSFNLFDFFYVIRTISSSKFNLVLVFSCFEPRGENNQPKIPTLNIKTLKISRFSRDGWQTVGRITNCNSISVSFMFSDGIIRKLESYQEYVVEQGSQPPEPQPGQIGYSLFDPISQ